MATIRAATARGPRDPAGRLGRQCARRRKAVPLRLAGLIEASLDELAATESLDAGKTISDCRDQDFPDVINTIRWYAEAADRLSWPR